MVALPAILAILFQSGWLVSIGIVLFAIFVGFRIKKMNNDMAADLKESGD